MPETVSKNLNKQEINSILNKIICIKNTAAQQRAFVSMLAVSAVSEYLEEKGIKIYRNSSLHSSCPVLEEFDIADIRTEKNIVIDVRAVLGDEYPQMCVPREHFSKGIRADIYVGVKIDKTLKTAEITGYIKTEDISRTKGNKNYFIIDAQELQPVKEIDEALSNIIKNGKKYIALDHEKASGLFIPFIDGIISEENKNYLIEHIAGCSECRKALINLYETERTLKGIKNKLLLDKDYTLRLLSGDLSLTGKEVEFEFQEDDEEASEAEENLTDQYQESEYVFEINKETIELPEKDLISFNKKETDFSEETEIWEPEKENLEKPSEENLFEVKNGAAELPEEPRVEGLFETEEAAAEFPEEPETAGKNKNKEETPLSEDILQKQSPKKRRHVDWADELVDDLITEEKRQEAPSEKEIVLSENFGPIDENLPEIPLAEQIEEKPLDENFLVFENQEEPLKSNPKVTEEVSKPAQEFPLKQEAPEPDKPASEEKDEEVENILETLDDVEVINEEDDIDSLLSFIDHEASESIIPPEQPVSEYEDIHEPSSFPPPVRKEETEYKEEKVGEYSKVLGAKQDEEQEDLDILLYEEGKTSIDEISQEDLMSIFDPASSLEEDRKTSDKSKFTVNTLFKDKSIVAFTVAVTLSTTVLFLYLGQINKQVQISGINNNNMNNNVIKKPDDKIEDTKPEPQKKEFTENREREPLRTYTREIIKTVKKDSIAEKPEKEKEIKELVPPEAEKIEKTPESPLNEPKEIPIRNISWELSASVAKKPKIKKYFLNIGYELKGQLSQNLYEPESEIINAEVNIYAEIDSSGNILRAMVYESSGLEKIDEKCLNTMREVIRRNELPQIIQNKEKIKLKLLIKI